MVADTISTGHLGWLEISVSDMDSLVTPEWPETRCADQVGLTFMKI